MFDLLSILICPKTNQRLVQVPTTMVTLVNDCIRKKLVRNVEGRLREKPVDGLFVREDKGLAYMIQDGLPIMIFEQAIEIQYISDRRWLSALRELPTEIIRHGTN